MRLSLEILSTVARCRSGKRGITQSLILQELRSFRSPLNNSTAERNVAITINFDPTHIEESQLHLLNEVTCVDSPAEEISGRYRTHEIWIGPDGCSKEKRRMFHCS